MWEVQAETESPRQTRTRWSPYSPDFEAYGNPSYVQFQEKNPNFIIKTIDTTLIKNIWVTIFIRYGNFLDLYIPRFMIYS